MERRRCRLTLTTIEQHGGKVAKYGFVCCNVALAMRLSIQCWMDMKRSVYLTISYILRIKILMHM